MNVLTEHTVIAGAAKQSLARGRRMYGLRLQEIAASGFALLATTMNTVTGIET